MAKNNIEIVSDLNTCSSLDGIKNISEFRCRLGVDENSKNVFWMDFLALTLIRDF